VLAAAGNFLYVFNMVVTTARQGGRVQHEQSDMCIALNVAKMARGGYWQAATVVTRYVFRICCAKVQDEK